MSNWRFTTNNSVSQSGTASEQNLITLCSRCRLLVHSIRIAFWHASRNRTNRVGLETHTHSKLPIRVGLVPAGMLMLIRQVVNGC